MNWPDRLNTVFTITTGDGSVFTPLWKGGETEKEYNATFFEFINLAGSLVDRKLVRARNFPLVFWFVGADNVDQANAFDLAANDTRAWTVLHPFYGQISGQPTKIKRNDQNYNATEITVDFWESINLKPPQQQVSIADTLIGTVNLQLATISPLNYSSKVNLKPADANAIGQQVTVINANITKLVSADTYSAYQTAQQTMFAGLDTLLTAPETAIQGVQQAILLASQFPIGLSNRLTLLATLYADAKSFWVGQPSPNNAAWFEAIGAICIGGQALASVTPIAGDYVTRTDVQTASSALSANYADYLATLDAAYVPLTDPVNNFCASAETQQALQSSVVQTVSGLFVMAFNAKQQRTIILEADSNLILLTHKYMGLDQADANLELMRQINGIKNKLLFGVKKGTAITYYI